MRQQIFVYVHVTEPRLRPSMSTAKKNLETMSPSRPGYDARDSSTMRVASPRRDRESGPSLITDRNDDPRDQWSDLTLDLSLEENNGDRITPLFFLDSITPIFPESAVREVMARAEAAERAAASAHAPAAKPWSADTPMHGIRVPLPILAPAVEVPPARPANTVVPAHDTRIWQQQHKVRDENEGGTSPILRLLASRGHHVSWMFWVAVGLLLLLMVATVCKAGKKLSLDDMRQTESQSDRLS